MIAFGDKQAITEDMAAENHENVFVFLDELLPHLFAVVAGDFVMIAGDALVFIIEVHVSEDNGLMVGVVGDDFAGPCENFISGFEFKTDDHELELIDRKVIPGIIVRIIKSPAEVCGLSILTAWEVFVELCRAIDGRGVPAWFFADFLITDIVITKTHDVGDDTIKFVHGFLGDLPFIVEVGLRDVAGVNDESGVELFVRRLDPARLCVEVFSQIFTPAMTRGR